jgi:hypothetical protein
VDELVEDEVLEVVELEVPRDQESAFPISAYLTKKWSNERSLSSDVSKAQEMRKECLEIWEQRSKNGISLTCGAG